MVADPSSFNRVNMADTCAVWNVLSSKRLYQSAISAGCVFSCTTFVTYECLSKPRSTVDPNDVELRRRLVEEQQKGRFQTYSLAVEDLQEMDILEKRKNLGKGELSSIAFAKKTAQAFLTDDKGARKLALEVIPGSVQTTPHLFGWLIYARLLPDSDKTRVITEHSSLNRPLAKYFEEIFLTAQQFRSYSGQ
jgi:hypothetical protein